jgi:DNA repair exonuclease SbcCD nuclease subunit
MSRVRRTVVNQVFSALQEGPFSVGDFDVKFPTSGENLIVLSFRPSEQYKFVVSEKTPTTAMIRELTDGKPGNRFPITTETPGEFKNTEQRVFESLEECIQRISLWTRRIREELLHFAPYQDDLTALREELEEKIKQHVKDPDERFSEEEISRLQNALDILAARLAEMEGKQVENEKRVKDIEKELAQARNNLRYYPKGIWYRTAGNKILDLVKGVVKSKEGRALVVEATKKMLGWDK